jgi:hypothetical protein
MRSFLQALFLFVFSLSYYVLFVEAVPLRILPGGKNSGSSGHAPSSKRPGLHILHRNNPPPPITGKIVPGPPLITESEPDPRERTTEELAQDVWRKYDALNKQFGPDQEGKPRPRELSSIST